MAYAWQARHGLSSAQYQAEFNSLLSQGYRLIDINGYSVGGVDRYAAIWEKSPGYEWQARHGLSSAEHQTLFATLTSQGYRPICVSGYEVAGTDRYASLWHKINGPEWRARHGMTPAQYQAEFDALASQGFRPVDVCGYTVAGQPRFAAIWDKSQIPNWTARHGLNAAEYQSEFTHWSSQGFLLWRVSGYEVAGQNFYAAIWIKGPSLTWWSRHGLSAADYQTEFNSMLARGFRLVKVNGYPLHGEARYAVIWHKPYLSDDDQSFIRQTVTTFMNNHMVPGTSLALTQFGRLVFAQGYGLANQATNEPVTTSTLFRIASVSKPITSVAVFKLIEAGLLNLGDRVFGTNAILGTTYGTQPYSANINQITVQHLLEHTSGWARSQDPMFGHFNLNQHELITWMLDNSPLTFVPGQTFDYLNFGYCVLGRVIERVSGASYADYVRQHVLAPCGISDMHIAGDTLADRRSNEAVYYTQSGWNPYAIRVSRMDAHGGWIASATDLARFLVRVDRFPTKPDILSSGSLATMYTPTIASRADGSPANYAKGWNIHPSGNYWHDGDIPGTASIAVRTNNGYCWAVLVNSRNDAQLQKMRTDLDNLMWTIVGRIRDWPSFDLF
ncbi:serine hydrolase [Paenibacillus profundus]|uniref:Serine hydrolase n=1 Tax=Paenibacillus profundus TaxID=1173085 RepID=A0ABS8YNU8_9BACL|nr:serine hydrolase [Paenibacillus profundus]MCE5173495.1 serine hydrolase [Paenibacillus profundus]